MAVLVSAAEAFADGKAATHPTAREYVTDMGYDPAELSKTYSDAWYAALYFEKGHEARATNP